MATNKDAAR